MVKRSVLGDFESALQRTAPPRCDVSKILQVLSPDDRQKVEEALANPRYTGTAIAAQLNKTVSTSILGRNLGEGSVQRHRRHICCRNREAE